MDITKLFEKLANTTHFKQELQELIAQLPPKLQEAYLMNDAQQLRKLISGNTHFSDTKTVANK